MISTLVQMRKLWCQGRRHPHQSGSTAPVPSPRARQCHTAPNLSKMFLAISWYPQHTREPDARSPLAQTDGQKGSVPRWVSDPSRHDNKPCPLPAVHCRLSQSWLAVTLPSLETGDR